MADKLAVLKDYPAEGPEVPDREKIVRKKDKHESGTGRRDKTKRDGKGKGNWGNPEDDIKHLGERDSSSEEEDH